jgi:hypothetical protein
VSTAPISDEQLDAISERATAASPGPWIVEDAPDLNRWVTSDHGTLEANFGYIGNGNRDDAQFVAHAREDIPLLLAEVDRLRAVEKAAYAFADNMASYRSHGSHIVAEQARQLRERLDQAQPSRATDRARHDN